MQPTRVPSLESMCSPESHQGSLLSAESGLGLEQSKGVVHNPINVSIAFILFDILDNVLL